MPRPRLTAACPSSRSRAPSRAPTGASCWRARCESSRPPAMPRFQEASEFLRAFLRDRARLSVSSGDRAAPGAIVFEAADGGVQPAPTSGEAYSLAVSPDGIRIRAGTAAGAFWAVQTLRQLLPPDVERGAAALPLRVPAVTITDAPRFAWRGSLVDVGRHYLPPAFIKRFIDLLALHKMNVLHWHLTEDQGWRLEIKKYPRLTSIGAWRTENDGTRYGGFYTQDQVRDIVEYARRRQVTVVPEIEMPGHARRRAGGPPGTELHRRDEGRADDVGRVRGRVLPWQGGDVPVPPERARRGDGALPVEGDSHRRRRSAEGPLEGVPAVPAADEGGGPAGRERAAELLHSPDRRLRPQQGARDHRLGRDPRGRPAGGDDRAGLARRRARADEREARRARGGVAVEPHLHQPLARGAPPRPRAPVQSRAGRPPARRGGAHRRRRGDAVVRGDRRGELRRDGVSKARGVRRSAVERPAEVADRVQGTARIRALPAPPGAWRDVRPGGSRAGGADAGVRCGDVARERANGASRRAAGVPLHDRRHDSDGSIAGLRWCHVVRRVRDGRRSGRSSAVRRCSSRPR